MINAAYIGDSLKDDNVDNGQVHIEMKDEENASSLKETDHASRLIYRVSDTPPVYLTFFFALQQCLMTIPNCTFTVAILAGIICAEDIESIKAEMFATTLFLAGLTTFFQNTIGVRLPVYQGPVSQYVISLLTLSALPEWKCPDQSIFNPNSNVTVDIQNYTDTYVLPKIRIFQGSLMVAGAIHMIIGLTGVLGLLLRFIGPLTIVPTLLLVGIQFSLALGRFCQSSWIVSSVTVLVALILGLYLNGKKMPIPVWTRRKGFHVIRYPLHQVLSMLISMTVGWTLCAILTAADVLSSDKDSPEYYARTDTRIDGITNAPWFYIPYPGQFGESSFSSGVFASFLVPTVLSILDSIADYYACARTVYVPPPPHHAINSGIAVEGFFSILAGAFGASHATTTSGSSIGVMGMTKVGSRRVFQYFAIQMILFCLIGKFSAFLVTMPYPVIGGSLVVAAGLFMGVVIANTAHVDLNSTRNLGVMGVSLVIGLMVPNWAADNVDSFNTGVKGLDDLIATTMTNQNLLGGIIACVLDNTIPGTLEERGMKAWQTAGEDNDTSGEYEEGVEIYDLPLVMKYIRRFQFLRYIPTCPTFSDPKPKS